MLLRGFYRLLVLSFLTLVTTRRCFAFLSLRPRHRQFSTTSPQKMLPELVVFDLDALGLRDDRLELISISDIPGG